MAQPSPELQPCIERCQACHAVCLQMAATHCLQVGGKHVEPAHFRLMLDCAQICQTSADFMLRQSELHAQLCALPGRNRPGPVPDDQPGPPVVWQ